MDFNVWCVFAVVFITVEAARFDLGPQRFYESSSLSPRRDQNTENREVVLYLTPGQIKALEAGGAVVRPDELENDSELEDAQQDNEDQPNDGLEQEQEQEQEENEAQEPEQEGEPEQAEQPEQEQENGEELQGQDLDFEEIFRILNEEQIEQEEANTEPALNVPQVTEETSEEEREIPPRFQVRQQQQQQQKLQQGQQLRQGNLLLSAEKKARSKIYSAIRYQPRNEQPQKIKVQITRQQQQDARQNAEQQEEPQTEAPSPLKRFRLVPYEIEEQSEEPAQEQQEQVQAQQNQEEQEEQQQVEEQTAEQEENQERLNALLTPLLTPERLAEVIGQRKSKLFENEIQLQSILNELKQSHKHNDQKYAIEIERLRANLEKQNTLSKAEAFAKTAPQLIKKEIQKRRPSQNAKQVIVPAPAARNSARQRQALPVENVRPVPTPIVRKQKGVVERPAPVEVEKRVPVSVTRNVYVKVKKPYIAERNFPVQVRKEVPVEIPNRKLQKVTILRHVWEH